MRALKHAVSSVMSSRILAPFGAPVLHLTQYALSVHRKEVIDFGQRPDRSRTAEFIRGVLTSFQPMTMAVDEAYLIHSAVLSTRKIPGDIAEVGVFRGQSARIICEVKSGKTLHLFDTFAGLPEPAAVDTKFKEGEFACSLPAVQRFLQGQPGVRYYAGLFPGTAGPVADSRFSFVHLDVDLYESTRLALEFFYPRLSPGGIIISHDYVVADGVRNAFDEFFHDKTEPVLEMTGNQCLVVKVT